METETRTNIDIPRECDESVKEEALRQNETSLDEIYKLLKEKMSENPEMFQEPLQKLKSNIEGLKTESSLISAFVTFGKYSGVALSKGIHNGKMIGVNPQAVARRKLSLGGRRRLGSGRPVKHPLGEEDNLQPAKARKKAPHNLSFCVNENVSLGKSHSSK